MNIAYTLPATAAVKGVDINAQKSITCSTTGEAMNLYHKAAERLLYVSRWNELTDEDDTFNLLDNRGHSKYGSVTKGDYIQVKRRHAQLTGSNAYDYWLIEKILQIKTETRESTAIRVRYRSNPSAKTQIYFQASNTNTLIVERHGHTVRVNFHPHREAQHETDNTSQSPVHQVLLIITTWLGLTANKWNALANGLLFD